MLINVVKHEYLTESGLVRTELYRQDGAILYGQGAPLTRDDLINGDYTPNVRHTIVHCRHVCNCDRCRPVWQSLEREYIFD